MSGFALCLRALTWWQAALCAIAALIFNAFVLPRLAGGSLDRPVDRVRGYPLGIVLYPLSVLLLILAFPARLDIAASAWGILACGDGCATLAGRAYGHHHLSWNPAKTWAGLIAFVMAGSAAGVLLAWWMSPTVVPLPPVAFVVMAPIAAAVLAGLAESLPVQLDDNLSVPAVAGASLWLASLVTMDAGRASLPALAASAPAALVVNTVVALGGWRIGTVRASGTITGWAIGVAVYACTGWPGWVLLFSTFLAAAVSSRLGFRRKALLGIAEECGGRRGGGNAFANTGLATIAALVAVFTPYHDAAMVAFVAALVAGGSDTIASEIGKAWGRRTYLVTTMAEVKPGTPGAMSLEGTAAGVLGALVLASLAAWLGLLPASLVWCAVAGAVVGSLVESALAATLEAPGIVNNDMLNFINTATGAIVALGLTRWV